jgi:hypothetical protein
VKGTFIRVLAAGGDCDDVRSRAGGGTTGQTFGEVVGKITDDQGAVLPGVTVSLSGPAVMGTPTAVSGSTGVYRFPAVPPALIPEIRARRFRPARRNGIVVPVRQTITVDAQMKLGVSAGNRHGERLVADRRRREHQRSARACRRRF